MPSEYRAAMGRLKAAQKTNYGAPLYSRLVNRPAGRRLAALAYSLHLSPNQVTGIQRDAAGHAVALAFAIISDDFHIIGRAFGALFQAPRRND